MAPQMVAKGVSPPLDLCARNAGLRPVQVERTKEASCRSPGRGPPPMAYVDDFAAGPECMRHSRRRT